MAVFVRLRACTNRRFSSLIVTANLSSRFSFCARTMMPTSCSINIALCTRPFTVATSLKLNRARAACFQPSALTDAAVNRRIIRSLVLPHVRKQLRSTAALANEPIGPEPFYVRHTGKLLMIPLVVLAIIAALLLLIPMFTERTYIAMVSHTFERGAISEGSQPLAPLTSLSSFMPVIQSIVQSNDGPGYRKTYWLLGTTDEQQLSSLLRQAAAANQFGVVYSQVTAPATFGRELGHLFSFIFQDEYDGPESLLRTFATDSFSHSEPLRSFRNFFPVLKKGAKAFKASTGKVPVLIIDGVDKLQDKLALDYLKKLARECSEEGYLSVVFTSSDASTQALFNDITHAVSSIRLP